MDVQRVLLDFAGGITVGLAVVVGIIFLVSLGIPRRVISRRLAGNPARQPPSA